MTISFDTRQQTLALTEAIVTTGIFPSSEFDNGGAPLATVRLLASNFAPGGSALAAGQLLSIASNTALFSLIGTTYGGDGKTTFALPDFQARAQLGLGLGTGLSNDVLLGETVGQDSVTLIQANLPPALGGTSAPVDDEQPGLGLHYAIRTQGIYSGSGYSFGPYAMGGILQYAGSFVPGGYMECNGQLLDIESHDALFNMIGTAYGGDGNTTFALPDLRGRSIVGASLNAPIGTVSGHADVTLGLPQMPTAMGGQGQPFDNTEPTLALNYIIALQGIFPSENGGFDSTDPTLGEIAAVAFNGAPHGWTICAGQLLPINQNQALFALLGTNFGGNGITNFALPDLRGKAVVGTGNGITVGIELGSDTGVATLNHIPPIDFTGTSADDTMYGGNGGDTLHGGSGNDTLTGWGGIDKLYGDAGGDRFNGGRGADRLSGGDGRDVLKGGIGNDRLDGGAGHDVLIGGAGADLFIFHAVATGNDTIRDWSPGEGDRLTIDASAFAGGLVAGAPLQPAQLVIGTAPTAAFGQFIFDAATGQLSWDQDGMGGTAGVHVAVLRSGGLPGSIGAADFDIIA